MTRLRQGLGSTAVLVTACGGGAPPSTTPGPTASSVAVPSARPAPPTRVLVDRGKLPTPGPAPSWAPPAVATWQLASGVRVYFQAHGATPLTTVVLVLNQGAATDPRGKAGLTALTADLLDEGAGSRGALELSDELGRRSIDYSASVDVDSVTLSMDLLADELDAATGLLADIVRRPKLQKAELDRRKRERLADLLQRESDPVSARALVLRQSLFGTGYASWLPDGTRGTMKGLSIGDVKRHYAALVQPSAAAFVVVGGAPREKVASALEAEFGDWKGTATARSATVDTAPVPVGVHLVDFPGATQTSLAVARRADKDAQPAYFADALYSRSLGEAFTSRVNLNLREDKGYTYGARSGFTRYQATGFFSVAANVKSEVTRASIDEVMSELVAPCGARPITAGERGDAIAGLLLGFPGRFESGNAIAWQYTSLHTLGRPVDWFERWTSRAERVTLDEIAATARASCDRAGYVVVLAGDRAKIETQLAGFGGELFRHDREGKQIGKSTLGAAPVAGAPPAGAPPAPSPAPSPPVTPPKG